MRLQNQAIVITGGTSGIGREIVESICERNRVLVIARSERRLRELARRCPGVETFAADLSREDELSAAAQWARARTPNLGLLINNAAVQYRYRLLDADFDVRSIAYEIAVNLTAPCVLTACLLPSLRCNTEAAILNINSALALEPNTAAPVHCATRGGLNAFTRSLRYQLEGSQIRVLQAFLPPAEAGTAAERDGAEMGAERVAREILRGVERNIEDNDVGKVKRLRALLTVAPPLARRVMKRH